MNQPWLTISERIGGEPGEEQPAPDEFAAWHGYRIDSCNQIDRHAANED